MQIDTDLYSGYDYYGYDDPGYEGNPFAGGDFDFGPPLYTGGDFDFGPPLYTGGDSGGFTGLGGTTGDQPGDYDMPTNPQTPGAFGGDPLANFLRGIPGAVGRFLSPIIAAGGGGGGVGVGGGIAALLGAIASRNSRQEDAGGGVGQAYAGPKQINRTVEQGKYGPIVRYAANGGLMQAYAQGGAVKPFPMQDGGFVMTKRAVDGAGGPAGMQQMVPEAQPIVGPGHGTSDSIPAYIQGKHGRTPAAVSNGEMYVPPGPDTEGLYALMKSLERNA